MDNNDEISIIWKRVTERWFVYQAKTIGWNIHHFRTSRAGRNPPAMKLLRFIDKHTSGRFHIHPNWIAFEDEADFLMFKLGWKD